MDVPPGTEFVTLDIDATFHRVPISPAQQPSFVVGFKNLYYIDHTGFSPSSSPSVFFRLADTMVVVYKAKGIRPIKK